MPEPDLSPEIATFDRLHDALKDQFGPDEWVVISSGELKAHFAEFADAALFVAAQLADRPTLVRQIDSPPVHVPYVLMRA
jgi:hypothetical protein